MKQPRTPIRDWLRPLCVCLFVSAVMTASVKHGTAFVDSVNGYHLHPTAFLQSLMHAWNSGTYLGFDNGGGQLTLFPGALVYALLDHFGVPSDVAQKLYFFGEFFAIALAITWFVKVAGTRITVLRPIVAVAPVVYVCNLYVAENIRGGSALLWPYAALPVLLGLMVLAIRDRRPVYYGLLLGVTAFFMTGINGTLLVINLLVCAAFAVFLVLSDGTPRQALRAAAGCAAVGLVTALATNAYWIGPYVYHLKTAWLAGIFSESISFHSLAANAPDVLRLLGDPGFFGQDKLNGWYFPFAPMLQGATVFAIASRILPLMAFGVFLYKRAWAEPLLRFVAALAIITVPLASGAHTGSDGGVWTAGAFKYLSAHVMLFQAFRGLEKWDSVLALAYAVLCAYFASLAMGALLERGRKHAWAAALPILLVPLTAIYPLVSVGAFKSQDLLQDGTPHYWSTAANTFDFPRGQRVAMFPEQYLPQYFWGNVGGDFANLALGHSATYSTAHGSGAPSEQTDFLLEAMYRTVYERSPQALPLLRRLSISDIVEQEDSTYAADDLAASPQAQRQILGAISGITEHAQIGDLTDYRVSGALPMVSQVQPLLVPFAGSQLLHVFPLLRSSEAAVYSADYADAGSIPVVLDPTDPDAAPAALTRAAATGALAGGPFTFKLRHDENVRIFIRRSPIAPTAKLDAVMIDAQSVHAPSVTENWRAVAITRLAAGSHAISASPGDDGTFDVKVVDDNDFQAVRSQLADNPDSGFFMNVDAPQTVNVKNAGMFTIRAMANQQREANYTFPLQFSDYDASGPGCREVPLVGSGAYSISRVSPPPSWYYDSALQPYTRDGLVPLALYGGSAVLHLYNPFQGRDARIHLRGAFAPLGDTRTITMRRPDGVLSKNSYVLPLTTNLQLSALPPGAVPADNDLDLTSSVTNVDYGARVPAGWSTIRLESNGENGLPRADDPLDGLVTFAALRGIDAYGCGELAYMHGANRGRKIASVSLLSTADDPQPSSIVSIPIPHVAVAAIPALRFDITESGDVSFTAIAHYRGAEGREWTSSIPFATQNGMADVALVPPNTTASGRDTVLTGVDVVMTLLTGRDAVMSNPRLTLVRADVRRLRSMHIGDVNRKPMDVRVPDVGSAGSKSLVLLIGDPNAGNRDVAFSTSIAGLYLGRAAQLQVLRVERISDAYARITMESPVSLPYTTEDGWRRKVRLFADGNEMQPAQSLEPLPGQFLVDGSQIQAIVPISSVNHVRDWRIVYVPPEWISASRYAEDTSELRIPLADGFTTLDGRSHQVAGTLWARAVSRTNTIDPDAAPISINDAFVEDVASGARLAQPPALLLDGRRVDMRLSAYGWYQADVALAAGDHRFAAGQRGAIAALILPTAIAKEAVPYGADSFWSGTVSAHITARDFGRTGAVVLRQAYSPGWVASMNGHRLAHFLADGYANGFLVPPNAGSIEIAYQPEQLLVFSRWISVTALLVSIIFIIVLGVAAAVPQWKAKYVTS